MSTSRYSRFRAHLYSIPLANAAPPNHGSVQCASCKRMTTALDPQGSYVCTCGNAVYIEPAPASTSAKR